MTTFKPVLSFALGALCALCLFSALERFPDYKAQPIGYVAAALCVVIFFLLDRVTR